jgi:hypothetical protein
LSRFDRARDIDPYFDPPWYWQSLGLAYLTLRRYDDALVAFERLPARGYRVAAYMAACHARLGRMELAAVFARECLDMRPEFSIGHFMSREPFKNPADGAHIAECLRIAGLPA